MHSPKTHPAATNPGRPPAEKQRGDTGAIIGGVAAAGGLVALGTWMHERNKPEVKLARDGPKIPDQFNMSGFSIAAFCRADWPAAVHYVLANGAELSIVVTAEGVAPCQYRIRSMGARLQEIFRLPAYFPVRPSAGVYTISATTGGPGVVMKGTIRLEKRFVGCCARWTRTLTRRL